RIWSPAAASRSRRSPRCSRRRTASRGCAPSASGARRGGKDASLEGPAGRVYHGENVVTWRPCYSAPTAPEAHLVKGFLEDRGVPCLLSADGASMYPLPTFGTGV